MEHIYDLGLIGVCIALIILAYENHHRNKEIEKRYEEKLKEKKENKQ